MLSTTAVYAFRIMVVLAAGDGKSMTSEKIAARAGIPADYSVKVLQMLARGKFVRAQRGRGGGFRLACDATMTSLLDVLKTIDQPKRSTAQMLREVPEDPTIRSLQRQIDEAVGRLHETLAGVTLKQIVDAAAEEPAAEAGPHIEILVDQPEEIRTESGSS